MFFRQYRYSTLVIKLIIFSAKLMIISFHVKHYFQFAHLSCSLLSMFLVLCSHSKDVFFKTLFQFLRKWRNTNSLHGKEIWNKNHIPSIVFYCSYYFLALASKGNSGSGISVLEIHCRVKWFLIVSDLSCCDSHFI